MSRTRLLLMCAVQRRPTNTWSRQLVLLHKEARGDYKDFGPASQLYEHLKLIAKSRYKSMCR